jgi:hypothetical protein
MGTDQSVPNRCKRLTRRSRKIAFSRSHFRLSLSISSVPLPFSLSVAAGLSVRWRSLRDCPDALRSHFGFSGEVHLEAGWAVFGGVARTG